MNESLQAIEYQEQKRKDRFDNRLTTVVHHISVMLEHLNEHVSEIEQTNDKLPMREIVNDLLRQMQIVEEATGLMKYEFNQAKDQIDSAIRDKNLQKHDIITN